MIENPVARIIDSWAIGISLLSLYLCLVYYIKIADYRKKQQAKYIFMGFSLSMVVGYVTEGVFPALHIRIPELTKMSFLLVSVFIGYAIWKYKLFTLTAFTAAEKIISTMSDCLLLVNREGKITFVNRSIVNLLEYSEDQLIGRTIDSLVTGITGNCMRFAVAHSREKENFSDMEVIFKTRSGKNIPISLSRSVMSDKDGTLQGVVYIGRDISDRKYLEEQLHQSQKMEAIGKLAGGIAHDFNNILTAILGYSQLLLNAIDTNDPKYEKIEGIKSAGERAAALTNQLLTFSRRQVFQPRTLNLNSLISRMEKILHPLIVNNIEIATVLDPELGYIMADPGKIEQVIINLAMNARDAMPNGGTLTIKTENVLLKDTFCKQYGAVDPGDYILLEMGDNGRGMDEETKNMIFEPYFTTKEIGTGSGLGLSTVYGIVKQSGGLIVVESEPSKGSAFKMYFPKTIDGAVIK